jgi:hypothetical protein
MQAPQLITAINVTESVTDTTFVTQSQNIDRLSIQVNATDATPAAKTFVAANVKTNVQSPASSIAITAHGFVTGLKVALSGTNLPTGLSATNYWVIVIDADTISVATSLANAVAGTKVSITGAGTTADAAFTPASLGSSTVGVKASLDGTNFFAFATPKTLTVSATGKQFLDCGQVTYPYVQIYWTAPTAGALTLSVLMYGVNTQVDIHD